MQDAWWLIDHKTKRMVEETLGLSGVLTFTVREKQPLHLTREQVATLSVDDFLQLWQVCTRIDRRSAWAQLLPYVGLFLDLTYCCLQGYITSLEALLKTGNDDVTSPTGQRLVPTPLRPLVQCTSRSLTNQCLVRSMFLTPVTCCLQTQLVRETGRIRTSMAVSYPNRMNTMRRTVSRNLMIGEL